MRKRYILGGLALLAFAGSAFAARQLEGRAEHAQVASEILNAPPAIPVVEATVLNHDVPIFLRGVGTVIAFNDVVVRSQITGQLTRIAFQQGQTVHKGDLLAEIDPRPYQAQLDQANANRDRDRALAANAKSNLDRYTALGSKGYASTQLIDTQRAQLAQAQASVASDEAVIEAAQANLSYTRLVSPIDGVTGIRQVDEGNVIHPTDANGLVVVTQLQPISLIFSLPQTSFVAIQTQMAKGPLSVQAYSQDDETELDDGKLDLIDNQIVQTTGTIRLRATFPNARHLLWPGELVNARLLLETRHHGLTIASSAIQQGPSGEYVWVVRPDATVEMHPVTVAQISEGVALLASGLQAGQSVVVDGQYRLQPGARVEMLTGDAARDAQLQSAVEQAIP